MPVISRNLAGVECVVNTPAVQAASHPAAGVYSAVFWEARGGQFVCDSPAGTLSVASNSSAIVVVRVSATTVGVSVAHPFLPSGAVTVTVDMVATGAGCSPGSAPGTTDVTLTLPKTSDMRGSTVSVQCAL